MKNTENDGSTRVICLGLLLAVLAAYAPIWKCGFISYDDPSYVTGNEMVQHGLNGKSLRWAFTTGYAANWHPLTWVSHMVDWRLYGSNPAGHHCTNLAFHLANTILLFLILQRMTGARWPAATVAALFGLHPLHVESVAWISERKDVLSTFFWMLSVGAYAHYVGGMKAAGARRKTYYALALLFFAMGLMAKPMLVTLPFLLLLLDYWPLARTFTGWGIWLEKIPFVLLASAASVVTFLVQQEGGTVALALPLGNRLANAVVSYARYVGKTLWPASLSVLYPHPGTWPVSATALAAAFLGLVTVLVLWRARRWPYLAVGWFWFLGTLVPAIGIVQVGDQAMADRYTYIPIVGLFIMAVWGGWDWHCARPSQLPGVLAVLALAGCLMICARQVRFWQSSKVLYSHAIAVNPENYMVYCNLGEDAAAAGDKEMGIAYYRAALRIAPHFDVALNGLGKTLFAAGGLDEALALLQQGVQLHPENASMHFNLGYVLLAKGRVAEALEQFEQQAALTPGNFFAQNNFADVLRQHGLADDAILYYRKALQIRPDSADARFNLGTLLWDRGRHAEAEGEFEQVLRLEPGHAQACSHLAWALATSPEPALRNGARAVELAQRAEELSGGENLRILAVLAAARAEAGQFPEAAAAARRAAQLARGQTNTAVVEIMAQQLKLYESSLPFRDNGGQEAAGRH